MWHVSHGSLDKRAWQHGVHMCCDGMGQPCFEQAQLMARRMHGSPSSIDILDDECLLRILSSLDPLPRELLGCVFCAAAADVCSLQVIVFLCLIYSDNAHRPFDVCIWRVYIRRHPLSKQDHFHLSAFQIASMPPRFADAGVICPPTIACDYSWILLFGQQHRRPSWRPPPARLTLCFHGVLRQQYSWLPHTWRQVVMTPAPLRASMSPLTSITLTARTWLHVHPLLSHWQLPGSQRQQGA